MILVYAILCVTLAHAQLIPGQNYTYTISNNTWSNYTMISNTEQILDITFSGMVKDSNGNLNCAIFPVINGNPIPTPSATAAPWGTVIGFRVGLPYVSAVGTIYIAVFNSGSCNNGSIITILQSPVIVTNPIPLDVGFNTSANLNPFGPVPLNVPWINSRFVGGFFDLNVDTGFSITGIFQSSMFIFIAIDNNLTGILTPSAVIVNLYPGLTGYSLNPANPLQYIYPPMPIRGRHAIYMLSGFEPLGAKISLNSVQNLIVNSASVSGVQNTVPAKGWSYYQFNLPAAALVSGLSIDASPRPLDTFNCKMYLQQGIVSTSSYLATDSSNMPMNIAISNFTNPGPVTVGIFCASLPYIHVFTVTVNLCPLGTSNVMFPISPCNLCPNGTYSDVLGSSTCKSCNPGTYLPQIGSKSSSDCLLCPNGTSNSEFGKFFCLPCGNEYCPMGTVNAVLYETPVFPVTNRISARFPSIPGFSYQDPQPPYHNVFFIFGIVITILILFAILILVLCRAKSSKWIGLKTIFRKIDLYDKDHSTDNGKPIIKRSEVIGGIFTFFFVLSAIFICVALCVQYVQNIKVSNQLVPFLDNPIPKTSINVRVEAWGYGGGLGGSNCSCSVSTFGIGSVTGTTSCASEPGKCILSWNSGLVSTDLQFGITAFFGGYASVYHWSISVPSIKGDISNISQNVYSDQVFSGPVSGNIQILSTWTNLTDKTFHGQDSLGFILSHISTNLGSQSNSSVTQGFSTTFTMQRGTAYYLIIVDYDGNVLTLISQIFSYILALFSLCAIVMALFEIARNKVKDRPVAMTP